MATQRPPKKDRISGWKRCRASTEFRDDAGFVAQAVHVNFQMSSLIRVGPGSYPAWVVLYAGETASLFFSLTNDEDLRHNAAMELKRPKPTEAELGILRVLWDGKAQSVRAIQQVLNESRPTGYTTVLKLIQIMTEKGLVERDETCRPQLYRARYSRQQTQRQLLGDLMNRAFGGSVKALVLQALATRKSSPQELEAIEKLLDRIEGERK